jgi:natural product biosynthesis luciferase-like monooxygenase protein
MEPTTRVLAVGAQGRARCVFVGDEALVVQCAEIARAAGLDIVALATHNDQARAWADEQGVTCLDSQGDLAAQFETSLGVDGFDVLFSVAYLRMVPDRVLDMARIAINFHDGPLPTYAGLNVTSWALLNEEPQHGITWHLMTPGIDEGEIVVAEQFAVDPTDTAYELNARCYEAALRTFPLVAEAIAQGELVVTRQPDGERAVYYRHQRPASATIVDPQRPAADTVRHFRALDVGVRQRHSLGAVRLVLGDEVLVVDQCEVAPATASARPGAIVAVDTSGLRLATVDEDLLITAASTVQGTPVDLAAVSHRHHLAPGALLGSPDNELLTALDELDAPIAKAETRTINRLRASEPTDLPVVRSATGDPSLAADLDPSADWGSVDLAVPAGIDTDQLVALVAAWAARITAREDAVFGYVDPLIREQLRRLGPLGRVPVVRLDVPDSATLVDIARVMATERTRRHDDGAWLADVVARDPQLREQRTAPPRLVVEVGPFGPAATARDAVLTGATIRLRADAETATLTVDHRLDAVDAAQAKRFADQLGTLLDAAALDPALPVRRLSIVAEADRAIYAAVNATEVPYDAATTVDALFRAQVQRTPHASALSFGATTLTYAELAERAARMAGVLRGHGVGRGDRVGIAVPRGIDMVVAVLATLDCGAAYLPLDPAYPHDRLEFMVDDAGIKALVARPKMHALLGRPGLALVHPRSADDAVADPAPERSHDGTDLAYVIYTSGSTGKPKGVMLEHHNANNFFVAMDAVIDTEPAGVWLAVTSLSFDISVLELLWTVTRGFHVVLKPDKPQPVQVAGARTLGLGNPSQYEALAGSREMSFSLFYFAANETTDTDGYRLLTEGARFADTHGFEAVWTPERHFHEFGGIYPNPAVAAAAVAAITERVKIRAGSVVLPLHHPARVAEEWSFVDNLSKGRVGIAFAAGWQPNDFVLQPQNYADAKGKMIELTDIVRRLWRGETVVFEGPKGPVPIRTLPRPVQPELPVWITSAGSIETFEIAGRNGYNVLTHLLGQSVEQVAQKVQAYRNARRAAGHGGDGHVTLMLHTYLARDGQAARAAAREPLKNYLRTASSLLKDMASAFPTLRGAGADADEMFRSLGEDEMNQLLDMATDRYLETSGLFGNVDEAFAMVGHVAGTGVDEVACLIDFGVATDLVVDSLPLLGELKDRVLAARADAVAAHDAATLADGDDQQPDSLDETVAELVRRHACTHLQCTPSLAAMLVADPDDRESLRSIQHMMVGGEALPTALAQEMRSLLPGKFTNMYGPTETTIWSLTHELTTVPDGPVPIGRPIANTTLAVLDPNGSPLPVGVFGELHLGGEGVARGYHNREELTAERFVVRPELGLGRLYATGDIARVHPAGDIEFAGRADFQVKIRGHRIELGEIETVLDQQPDVVQSVVAARTEGGAVTLVAYVVLHGGRPFDAEALRAHVGADLPEIMVPAVVVKLDAFPLTPNGKVDRKALPAPPSIGRALTTVAPSALPEDEREQMVAAIWTEALGRPVGRDDNFFEIGGHSLLAVKVFRSLADTTGKKLALTDIFRYPTVRTFAAYLESLDAPSSATPSTAPAANAPTGMDRGAMRRRAMARRGGDA